MYDAHHFQLQRLSLSLYLNLTSPCRDSPSNRNTSGSRRPITAASAHPPAMSLYDDLLPAGLCTRSSNLTCNSLPYGHVDVLSTPRTITKNRHEHRGTIVGARLLDWKQAQPPYRSASSDTPHCLHLIGWLLHRVSVAAAPGPCHPRYSCIQLGAWRAD
jgi:hypothetical protein